MSYKSLVVGAIGCSCLLSSVAANAALTNLGPGSFTPAASVITFSEVPLGTTNPVYTFGTQTVSFAGHFAGQTVTSGSPRTITGSPSYPPFALVTGDGTDVFTANDGAPGATSPILSGTPLFNGPISILFSTPVAAVGLKGGYFDTIGATTIEAFDVTGASLGTIVNSTLGFEFYGLFDSTGSNIAGVSFYITGSEPAGFEIDDVTFGDASVVRVPEPASLALVGLGLAGLLARRRQSGAAV